MIVCGTDFSDHATAAADVAAAFARKLRVPLKLVHVIDELVAEIETGGPRDAISDPRRAQLRAHAELLRAKHEIEVDPITVFGVTADKLVEIAASSGARVLIVGALGRERRQRWLLGSVAERVAQTSRVPVLVIRDGAAIVAWARGEPRPLRILVGVEPTATSRAALHWAAGLRQLGACDLVVAQVAWPPGEHVRLGIPAPMPLDDLRPEIEQPVIRDLQAWTGALPGPGDTSFLVRPGWGRVDVHLTQLASEAKADLIVVGTHQRAGVARLWQGSVSRRVLHDASLDVACVPRGSGETVDEVSLPQLRRVLAPTDFSALANRAIPFAYGLVGRGGIVHLLHVVTGKPDEDAPDPIVQLHELVPPSARERDIETTFEIVTQREPGLAIGQAAGRLGVDAICMGTHGRSGVARLVLGSQAQQVLQHGRRPVVLIPPERDE